MSLGNPTHPLLIGARETVDRDENRNRRKKPNPPQVCGSILDPACGPETRDQHSGPALVATFRSAGQAEPGWREKPQNDVVMDTPRNIEINDRELFEDSLFYKEFAAEREEILRHKWLESEKARRDIGFEKALLDWVIHHRSSWLNNRRIHRVQ